MASKKYGDDVQLILRIPLILAEKIKSDITLKKAKFPRFRWSQNEYILECVRKMVDGVMSCEVSGEPMAPRERRSGPIAEAKPTAQEIAARFGIKTGATIDEVEPRLLTDDPMFGVAAPEPIVDDETEPEVDWEARCIADFTEKVVRVGAPKILGPRGWAKMDWEQRYAALKEAKERES